MIRILAALTLVACTTPTPDPGPEPSSQRARNAILFVGDGMGISTVSAARVFSKGVDGQLNLDSFPHHALSRTATTDYITPDSAGTMSAMITGTKTNNLIISLDASTEPGDFNDDGDGARLSTVLEEAKAAGKRVGIVTTARITHATPAACYAHIHHRELEDAIALQALPTDATYNTALGEGVDLLIGGGRRHFLPSDATDEEGERGLRADGRDLREEFQAAGYSYVWNADQFEALGVDQLPLLALFDASHMAYEFDRPQDLGGEPRLSAMTRRAIELLEASSGKEGWFLVVEAGRIDHAHHSGNAQRSLRDTVELDEAIGVARSLVDERDTLILATADHSHTFQLGGYPLRPLNELPYRPRAWPPGFEDGGSAERLLGLSYGLQALSGEVVLSRDANGVPFTALLYGNGPGARRGPRVSPADDRTPGHLGVVPDGPLHPAYRQEARVPFSSETHGGEEVSLYGVGPGAERVRGTLPNTQIAEILRAAMGL